MSLNITGKIRVFRKDYNNKPSYSTAINKKEQDGAYSKMYVNIQFKQGIEVQNGTDINITNGFITHYKDKNGLSHIKFVIMDFEELNKQMEISPDSELPF